ncbi:MAG: anti-sigma factor [Bacteroidota bacterium]
MNIQEYILSGVVELYVAGALCEEDARELESLALLHPELKQEIEQVEIALEAYAMANQLQPDASLKGKIFASIHQQPAMEAVVTSVESNVRLMEEEAPSAVTDNSHTQAPIQLNSRYNWLAIAASVALLLASTGIGFRFYQQNQSLQSEIATLKTDTQKQQQLVRSILTDPDNQMLVLKGSDKLPFKIPQAEVKIFWNARTQQVNLSVSKLPALGEDEQYQLWALKDDKPIDAGVFDANGKDLIKVLKTIASADKWAVTIEPKGGSPQPHLEKLCLLSAG